VGLGSQIRSGERTHLSHKPWRPLEYTTPRRRWSTPMHPTAGTRRSSRARAVGHGLPVREHVATRAGVAYVRHVEPPSAQTSVNASAAIRPREPPRPWTGPRRQRTGTSSAGRDFASGTPRLSAGPWRCRRVALPQPYLSCTLSFCLAAGNWPGRVRAVPEVAVGEGLDDGGPRMTVRARLRGRRPLRHDHRSLPR